MPPHPANFLFLVDMGFFLVGQAALELLTSSDLPTSVSQSAGITGQPPYPLLIFKFFFHRCGSCCVRQAALKLLASNDPPNSASQSNKITGVNHCA